MTILDHYPTKTAAAVALADSGLKIAEIASALETTANAVNVMLWKANNGFSRSGSLAARALAGEAERRGSTVGKLRRAIVDAVAERPGLLRAVLDDVPGLAPRRAGPVRAGRG